MICLRIFIKCFAFLYEYFLLEVVVKVRFIKWLVMLVLGASIAVKADPPQPTSKVGLQGGKVDKAGKYSPARPDLNPEPSGVIAPDAGKFERDELQNEVRNLGAGRFAIGQVSIDAKARTASLPAILQMRSGQIEYALVHSLGKVHESLFVTEVKPEHLHIAALLLGVSEQESKEKGAARPAKGANKAKVKVKLEVIWKKMDLLLDIRWEISLVSWKKTILRPRGRTKLVSKTARRKTPWTRGRGSTRALASSEVVSMPQ